MNNELLTMPIKTNPIQSQYKANLVRHSLGEGGTNPINEKPEWM